MISENTYQTYLSALVAGRRSACQDIVSRLLDEKIDLKTLYTGLFQRSMYRVGELWETNQITVANEHLATAITEGLLNLAYPHLFAAEKTGKKAVITCTANEFHQLGGRMAADVFELNGWDAHFLGANTPVDDTIQFIQEENPDMVGLSLSILSNMDHLKQAIERIRSSFPDMPVIVGGQAFRWGGIDAVTKYPGTVVVPSINELEKMIEGT